MLLDYVLVGLLNNGGPLVDALCKDKRPPKSGMLIEIMPYVRGVSVQSFGVKVQG